MSCHHKAVETSVAETSPDKPLAGELGKMGKMGKMGVSDYLRERHRNNAVEKLPFWMFDTDMSLASLRLQVRWLSLVVAVLLLLVLLLVFGLVGYVYFAGTAGGAV